MKLTFVKPYKSLTSCPELELPDFVVLTGVNGAGKSHLLEAIGNGCVQIDSIALDNQTRPIRLFNWISLVPQDCGAFAPYQITQERDGFWNEISQYIRDSRTQFSDVLMQWNRPDLARIATRRLVGMTVEDLISTGSTPEQASNLFHAIKNATYNTTQYVSTRFVQNDPNNRQRLMDLLQNNSDVPLIAFEDEDFYECFPKNWQPVDVFQQSFGRLFAGYQRNWMNNKLRTIASSEGEAVSFLTDKEFIDRFGEPPWIFVNRVLETANLDFRIDHPSKYEERLYEPILSDRITGTRVKFTDLSSGEKVLMSFALCLYYAQDSRQIVDYPKVLLFDEIDAPLHPSMTQSLLRTINEVLVKHHGIKVILTTHSPSTVALSEEVSLYAMYKAEKPRLRKTTKDKALAILTTGVPTLSINYDNRRQVFVESQYDVLFYERIYEKLKHKLIPEISLNFIESGVSGSGSSSEVKEVVNQLHKSGNQTVYGIIDWDLQNQGNDRVKVLGRGKRYSIENYILDPLLLAAFLLREKWIDRSTIGLSDAENYFHLSELDNTRLQIVADFIIENVRVHAQPKLGEDRAICEYNGGQTIDVPLWYLQTQGHQLETAIKETFPELKRFQKEAQLKREIILKVIDDVPSLIPKDFISLFAEIQGVDL